MAVVQRALRLTTLLVVLAVAALGGLGWLYLDLKRTQDTSAAAAEAAQAARAYAADMLSYDHRTIEADLARARSHATGPLAEHYANLAGTFIPQVRRQSKVQQATVAAVAVEEATPERVKVLVFLNTSTSQTGGPARLVQNRARLVMVVTDGRWLVSGLSTLIGNTPIR
uniref:hypothetical protein n=1 Tax=Herbidospora sakaeratensis TaxID=564415 RepID=UPI0007858D92|nr:hypothetical protein [Herbidospora sakaeratensis]